MNDGSFANKTQNLLAFIRHYREQHHFQPLPFPTMSEVEVATMKDL
jgi:hypothetical protein